MKNSIPTKALALLLCALLAFALTGCGSLIVPNSGSSDNNSSQESGSEAASTEYTEATAASDSSVSAEETTGKFSISTADGAYTQNGGIYTVTSAGTYSVSGALEGQIVVDSGDTDEVILELNGVTITNSSDSPIKILSADEVEISSKKDTDNVINDTRSAKTDDDETQGEGAIYAK
ncbi:MAG: carbohydrate-binding domain-containing protein, partial [Clostridia bacterium]|nr:carbohydrate-binding domain-containing protein [Clostridia bacterium]